ncbi:MAG: prepilin peptidase [Bdellovibrionales bacterium]|nr:prepilin peptidase [Bdellovibrionales bacterium]
MTLPVWLGALYVFILGLCFGSFATVLCYRIPRDIPLGLFSHRRSACPGCGKIITPRHNIPLLSYILQRGRCAECGMNISGRYPLIEVTTAICFVATYLAFLQSNTLPVEGWAWWAELVKVLYFTLSLVAIVFIDIEFRIIPDRFSLGNWGVALAAAVLWGSPSWELAVLGSLFGFGSFYLLAWVYERFKGIEGLGFGDVKMMGWLGAWLGILATPYVILLASFTGLAVGIIAMRTSKDGLQTAIPFGPFLAAGAYAVWILQCLGHL